MLVVMTAVCVLIAAVQTLIRLVPLDGVIDIRRLRAGLRDLIGRRGLAVFRIAQLEQHCWQRLHAQRLGEQ